MFVRRHRLTIEIEQQTLRIHQRTASTTTVPAPNNPDPCDYDPSNPDPSNPEQSHHTSAADILPETKLPKPEIGAPITPDSDSNTRKNAGIGPSPAQATVSMVSPEPKALQAPNSGSTEQAP
jgi:hypothetical protein